MRKTGAVFLCIFLSLTTLLGSVATAGAAEKADVPKITVTTENGSGWELQKDDGYVNAEISITDSNGYELSEAVSFKVRGNTTALSWVLKKAYTFKFAKKKNVLGMGSGKKWALIANAFDPTLLRNYIAFDIADELEIPYTSNRRYSELWVDGKYLGCYMLYEPVQQGKDRVDIDIESNDGKKDFMIEYEYSREEEGVTYFTVDNLRFIASEPEEPDEEQLDYIVSTMTDIQSTLKRGNKTEISEKIDLPSFVKFYLLNEFVKTYDFSMSSVYYYYKDGILYAGPPWDYDLSAGNEESGLSARCTSANDPEGIFITGNLCKYLYKLDWFKELVKAEYEKHYNYFKSISAEGGLMDTVYNTYGDLFARNYNEAGWNVAKWWINIQKKPLATYGENYDFLKNWFSQRSAWFDGYFKPFYREYMLGDADNDGKVDVNDVTEIQKYVAHIIAEPDDAFMYRAKLTDRELSIIDATTIQRVISGIPDNGEIGSKKSVTLPH